MEAAIAVARFLDTELGLRGAEADPGERARKRAR